MATPTAVQTAIEPPFVGLKSYTEEQSNRFFGRDRECATLIGNLRGARLTLLYAESGVGKSSLLRAGLAAELRRNAQHHLEAGRPPRLLPVLFSSYSEDPVQGLIDAVSEAVRPFVGGLPPLDPPTIPGVLEQAATAVGGTLLVLLDQFEEYYLYRSRHPDTDRFADEVAACVRRRDLNANFLISIREDSYARLGDLFRGRIDDVYANFLHLDHLGRAGGEEAIRGPVTWFNGAYDAGIVVEDALVKAVLDGVRLEKPGAAPAGDRDDHIETTYLQLVMERVWDEETREGSSCLRAATLHDMGGPRAVIANHLDHTMDRFSNEDQSAAAAAFRFLVTRSGTKIALSVRDLSELSGVEASRLDPLLRRLAEPDVHILRPVEQRDGDDASYEIYHDALGRPILEWRARRQQREDAARSEELAQQVERERAEKERAQALEAEAQRQKAEAEHREVLERRRKRIAVGVLIGLVVVGAAVAFVVVTGHERARARAFERAKTSIVIASELDDLSRPLFGDGQKALAAFEAYRLSPTFDARKRVQAALQDNVGMPAVLYGHRLPVLATAWRPGADGTRATGSADGTVRLWRPDGKPDGSPLTHGGSARVTGLAFTPNGRALAVSRDSGAVDLWKLHGAARFVRRLTIGRRGFCEDPCHPIALAPDGQTLAAQGRKNVVELWRLPGQNPRRAHRLTETRLGGAGLPGIHSLAFSSDGRRLAVGSPYDVTVWRLGHGHLRRVWGSRGYVDAYSVAWSPSGELAAGADDGVRRWDKHGDHIKSLSIGVTMTAVAFARGGAQLVTGGYDDQVTTWDARTLRAVGVPRPHSSSVDSLAVSPDGNRILAGDDGGVAKEWPVRPKGALAVDATALHGADDLAVLPGGILATYAGRRGALRLWRVQGSADVPRRPSPLATLRGRGPFTASGSQLVGLGGPSYKQVTVWDLRGACARMATVACRQGRTLPPVSGSFKSKLALDPSGTKLAVGSDKGVLTLWDIRDLHAPRRLVTDRMGKEGFDQLAFAPRGRLLLARAGSTTRLVNYRLARVGGPLHGQGQSRLYAAAFSPRDRILALGGDDATVTLLDLADPAHRHVLGTLQQSSPIRSLAFSLDGKALAAGDFYAGTCVYDMNLLRTIGGKTCLVSPGKYANGEVDSLAFDTTGRALITDDAPLSEVTLWSPLLWTQKGDAATEARLNAAVCRLAGRNLSSDEWEAAFLRTQLAGHWHRTCPPGLLAG